MSNEAYKLRGKQKESGKWVYGGFYMDETGWYIVTAPDSFVKIEPVTLGRKYRLACHPSGYLRGKYTRLPPISERWIFLCRDNEVSFSKGDLGKSELF